MRNELLRVAVLSALRSRRDQLVALLDDAREIECVGTAAMVAELGRLTASPGAIFVDGSDVGSLEALVQSNSPVAPFVILSDELEHEIGVRALLAGGVAILERNPSAAHLIAALRAAVSGLAVLSPTHAVALMDSPVNIDTPRSAEWIQPLTPRELQILRMLSDGLPNKSIAAELQISEHTAKFHVGQILAKLGAESRTEAVTIGIRHGLVMI
jgi:DNA-binding NarL/FixJ family response regulator